MFHGGVIMSIGWIFAILFTALGAGLLSSELTKRRPKEDEEEDAMKIVKERYARGELDEDEFEHMKSKLLNV